MDQTNQLMFYGWTDKRKYLEMFLGQRNPNCFLVKPYKRRYLASIYYHEYDNLNVVPVNVEDFGLKTLQLQVFHIHDITETTKDIDENVIYFCATSAELSAPQYYTRESIVFKSQYDDRPDQYNKYDVYVAINRSTSNIEKHIGTYVYCKIISPKTAKQLNLLLGKHCKYDVTRMIWLFFDYTFHLCPIFSCGTMMWYNVIYSYRNIYIDYNFLAVESENQLDCILDAIKTQAKGGDT